MEKECVLLFFKGSHHPSVPGWEAIPSIKSMEAEYKTLLHSTKRGEMRVSQGLKSNKMAGLEKVNSGEKTPDQT